MAQAASAEDAVDSTFDEGKPVESASPKGITISRDKSNSATVL